MNITLDANVHVHVHHEPSDELRGWMRSIDRKLAALAKGEGQQMAAIDDLNEVVAGIRAAQSDAEAKAQDLGGKLDAALERLSDNPTAAAVEAAVGLLNEAKTGVQGIGSSLAGLGGKVDQIDPAVPDGPINPDTTITNPEPA